VMQQAFHVIFLIDKSGSMIATDRLPLPGTPMTTHIARYANNRLGAVYSSLHAFWTARSAVASSSRRDAYTAIFHDAIMTTCFANDFTSTPDQMLQRLLPTSAGGSNDFDGALKAAQAAMERFWSAERAPVVIFLSDGEWNVTDQVMHTLCRSAVRLGKTLSFHGVAFGPDSAQQSLRRMVQIAREVETTVPTDCASPAVESSYAEALDTINLAQTFLGLAESLRKPRASLIRS